MDVSRRHLHEILSSTSDHSISNQHSTAEFLRDITSEENLRSLFDELRSSEEWLNEVASRSYEHQNGFDKIKLLKSESPEYKLRLHIWWPENLPQSPDDVNFHDHRWDFHSILLSGKMKFMNFEIGDTGMSVHKYEYVSVGEDEEYGMANQGTTNLSRRFGGIIQEGVNYSISNEVVHKTYVPVEDLTATLIVRGPDTTESARVFSKEPLEAESIDATRLSPKELKEKLSQLEKGIFE